MTTPLVEGQPAVTRRSRLRRAAGWALGAALLAGAVIFAARDAGLRERMSTLWRDVPAGTAALLILLPMVNWVLTSGVFWSLTRVRAKVSGPEMGALVGAGWLLNFLPLSPGLLGRVAYHKRVHALPVRTSARIVVESIVGGWAAFGLVGSATFAAARGAPAWVGAAGVIAVLAGTGLVVARRPIASAWVLALVFKCLDLAVWGARYWIVLHACGLPATALESLVIALLAQTAMLVPGIGNGLGLREWAVGLVAAWMPGWWHEGARGIGPGMGADLLNRAGELLAAAAVGLACAAWLARNGGRPGPAKRPENGQAGR